jgi:(S)-mandelate dehydrogenase
MVTVDSLIPGNRELDVRNRFAHALHFSPRIVWDAVTHPHWVVSTWFARGMPRFESLAEFLPLGSDAYALAAYTRTQRNPFYSWEDIAWLRSQWTGPLVIKGILTADDARLAASHGADAVVVSNHGGRSLDGMPATLDVLPSVVATSGGMPVLVDSSFRRGSDIVKALALGAHGVLLGRAPLYGDAAAGEAGAGRALEILLQETDRVMGLLGVDSVDALGHQHVGLQPA